MEVGTNRKPVCDFLLVINNNWQPISYRFGVIAVYCSNFGHCVFEPPLGGTTYDVHLGLNGKRAVGCASFGHQWNTGTGRQYFTDIIGLPSTIKSSINVNRTFFARCYSWGATSVNSSKIGDFAPTQSVLLEILGRMGRPTNHFCTDS